MIAFLMKHGRQLSWTLERALGFEALSHTRRLQRWLPLRQADRAVIRTWAERELAPWRSTDVGGLDEALDDLNETHPTIFLADFADAEVVLRPKPDHLPDVGRDWFWRIEAYRAFFERVARDSSVKQRMTIAFDVADLPQTHRSAPVFSFQKARHSCNVLMPDPDFFLQDWYSIRKDFVRPRRKRKRAVFAGSSTGALTLTQDMIRDAAIPRLSLAAKAMGEPDIDISITAAVQCADTNAENLLKSMPYYNDAWYDLERQFENKFLISIDGNGPTCSRLVRTLLSRSVLLKHSSDHLLYYFDGLQEGTHYLPFRDMADLKKIIAGDAVHPSGSANVIKSANVFARRYLSRPAVELYTAELMSAYAKLRC